MSSPLSTSLWSLFLAGTGFLGAGGCSSPAATKLDAASLPDAAETGGQRDSGEPDGGTDVDVGADAGARGCLVPADPKDPLMNLADTGCMDPKNGTRFAAFAVPYEVNSPLWSDAADKDRAFVLPPGGKIHVVDCAAEADACLDAADDGRWVFPVGTILLKNFLFDGKVLETRLLDALPNGTWVGYSYQWNEAQTTATVVGDQRVSVSFNTGKRTVDWQYPKRRDCGQCHTDVARFVLGTETAQMNRVPSSAALGTQNQLDKFAAMGLFETAPAKPYKAPLPTPYSGSWGPASASASVAEKTRSYLHANCGFCHRPDGEFKTIDLRYDVPFKDTHLCNSVPAKGTQDVDGATNLTPGKPDLSVTWLRMSTLGNGRMPTLASAVQDKDAMDLVSAWITGIKACP